MTKSDSYQNYNSIEVEQGPVNEEETFPQAEKRTFFLPKCSCAKSSCLSKYDLGHGEWQSLILLVLCYTCVFASTTIMVGGSAVAIVSVGGEHRIAPVALGVFFVGAAAISTVTAFLFDKLGRKIGFIIGSFLGVVGGVVGMGGIAASSVALVILSAFPTGMALGVGLHLRFAAMEVVHEEAKPFAMTLVLSGGCIAAFLGPESQLGTKDMFGDDLEYFGSFMMIAIFNFVGAVLVFFVIFPTKEVACDSKDKDTTAVDNGTTDDVTDGQEVKAVPEKTSIGSILARSGILASAALATLSWSIMAMPMSIFRVAMSALGYSSRLSLVTLELHFLGMYAPGFFAGSMIRKHGTGLMSFCGSAMFALGLLANLFSKGKGEGSPATWIMGLILLGVGWHFTFASATIMLANTYKHIPHEARRVQSINDVIMFGISGSLIVSTGYIYDAGGSGIEGWRLLNFVVVGLTVLLVLLLLSTKRKASA